MTSRQRCPSQMARLETLVAPGLSKNGADSKHGSRACRIAILEM